LRETYLEVTFRRGRAIAAYFYLPRRPGQRSYRTEEVAPCVLVDYGRSGRPIGIEITAPTKVTLATVNRVLRALGQPLLTRQEFAPLRAA
jgi:uncharacterized protein YuzE